MKRCKDCQSFNRPYVVGWCAIREATPQPWLAEECGDFERREMVKCERCAGLEAVRERLGNRIEELASDIQVHMRDAKQWRQKCAALESALRKVDELLENEFGGVYLSAPDGGLHDIREMLRGER